jgi:NAD+ kinase
VLVLKKLGDELLEEYLSIIQHLGVDQNLSVLIEPSVYKELHDQGVTDKMPYVDTWAEEDAPELHAFVDFVVCLGGDGLVLHATHLFGPAIPPIIAFRLGSLGFLTPHEYNVHMEHLDAVINGSDVRCYFNLTIKELFSSLSLKISLFFYFFNPLIKA